MFELNGFTKIVLYRFESFGPQEIHGLNKIIQITITLLTKKKKTFLFIC